MRIEDAANDLRPSLRLRRCAQNTSAGNTESKGSAGTAIPPSRGSKISLKENALNSETNTISVPECEALSLGLRMVAVRNLSIRSLDLSAEARRGGDTSRSFYLDADGYGLADIESALRGMISAVEAKTLEGAAIQACHALAMLDDLRGSESDTTDGRALQRLLYSVIHAIDRHCDRPLGETFGDDVFSWHLDPWRPLDERFALVDGALKPEAD